MLLVLAVMVPALAAMAPLTLGARLGGLCAVAATIASAAIAVAILVAVGRGGVPLVYVLGGWAPPLGIMLRADGLSAAMLCVTALVMAAVVVFARAGVTAAGTPAGPAGGRRQPFAFWTMLMGVWAALSLVWLGSDLFNLYVALELLTFSAVPLVCLEGKDETVAAALRYLLFALIGSLLYLLGVGLLYGAYGTLDIAQLAVRLRADPATYGAAGLMIAGLLAKTALFPLHLWLPPAHAGAPAAASATLSALVVKGSFFIVLRLWFDLLGGGAGLAWAGQILAALGACAILFGSVLALRQARLKLLVAYSTVAQIGYLFLIFALAGSSAAAAWSSFAWTGGMLQLIAHALAKAAMFMAAGLVTEALGHDRVKELGGLAQARPATVLAIALAGMSLIGLPPSGGFVAKLMLLTASVTEGQWWWALVILTGGVLAAFYMFRVLASAWSGAPPAQLRDRPGRRVREAAVLGLVAAALLLGAVPLRPLDIFQVGRPGLAPAGTP